MSSGPLAGVTVVENASYISGPFAGLLLAELGADVVKVEAPGSGDPFRRCGGTSPGRRTRPQFASLNYGKRSVAIDLREPVGRVAYLQPVSGADALIETVDPGRWTASGSVRPPCGSGTGTPCTAR
jgi:crotonobetainyl-CoA:carnitine CoA-transferase CaiB-like acyl-CoA transferase